MLLSKRNKPDQTGLIMLTIIFTSLFIGIMGGIFSLFVYQSRLSKKLQAKERAIQIAEAGINYYRWHLAHAPEDYADGTGQTCVYPNSCGPYQHEYNDPSSEEQIGTFELKITPPPVGSTIVTINSTGWVEGYENQKRIVEVRYGIPSLSAYTFLSNSNTWFGSNESVIGPLHSNGGIRMDGSNNGLATSAQLTYICTEIHNCSNEEKSGIWGSGSGNTLWQFPVPLVDFNTITLDLYQIKTEAQSSGAYYADSGAEGYKVVFKNTGNFDIYKINSLKPVVSQLSDNGVGYEQKADEPDEETVVSLNESPPANGLIFIEDNVWVEGVVNGRFTLVSAKLIGIPTEYTTIRINNNLTYLDRDGTHILGLIAEKDIKVPNYAPNELTIDAIMIAQNGRVFRNLYSDRSIQNSIEVYGSIITNKEWTWNWCEGNPCALIDGYTITESIYDKNATFAPPPYFPTTGEYTFISWEEKISTEP